MAKKKAKEKAKEKAFWYSYSFMDRDDAKKAEVLRKKFDKEIRESLKKREKQLAEIISLLKKLLKK